VGSCFSNRQVTACLLETTVNGEALSSTPNAAKERIMCLASVARAGLAVDLNVSYDFHGKVVSQGRVHRDL
jgi:hypothetical protein